MNFFRPCFDHSNSSETYFHAGHELIFWLDLKVIKSPDPVSLRLLLKRAVFLALIAAFGACTKSEPFAIIPDHEIMFSKDKAFLYHYYRIPENDTMFMYFKPVVEDGVNYVIETGYTRRHVETERKHRIENGTKECVSMSYRSFDDTHPERLIAGRIVEHSISADNKKIPTGMFKSVFEMEPGKLTEIKTLVTFDKDTVYEWEGEQRPTLKFRIESELVTGNKYPPFDRKTMKSIYHAYSVKGVGTALVTGGFETYKLVNSLIRLDVYGKDEAIDPEFRIRR
jgi:hypothetical protein